MNIIKACLVLLVLVLSGCASVCQTRQSRCNGPLVEVCGGGKWRRFADCSQVLKLEDGKVVKGNCRTRESTGRVGCLREDEK